MKHSQTPFGQFIHASRILILLVFPIASHAANFTDSSRVNVLRQYDPAGNFLIPSSISGNGVLGQGGNDGSGKYDDWFFSPNDATRTGTNTFTLPGPKLVGSFQANFNNSHRPGNLEVQGFVNGVWTTLATVASPGANPSGTFTPTTVTALRYIVTGPSTSTGYVQDAEFQVFLTSGQTVPYDSGYNLLHDAGKVIAISDSVTSGPWSLRTSGLGGSQTVDGNYFSNVHGQNGRTFFTLTLDQPTAINRGHLGWYNGQVWSNYQVYGSTNSTMPALQSLAATDVATVTAAGWTLELDSSAQVQDLLFNFQGGELPWKHLAVVWNGTGALVEFEAFIPEPSTTALLAMGGLLLLRWRSRLAPRGV